MQIGYFCLLIFFIPSLMRYAASFFNSVIIGISVAASGFVLLEDGPEPHYFRPASGGTIVIEKEEGEDETREQQLRREWIERMHRAAPGTDWRKTDRKARLKQYGNFLVSNLQKSAASVSIGDGILTGSWIEKGSDNLAGRVHTGDLDTLTQKLYLGSAGGNIWKGNINGTDWEVLNDQLQFESINAVRVIRRNNQMRLLVGTWDKFIYYSDNDGVTWENSTGLESLTSGNHRIERVLVAGDSAATVYVLLRAPNGSGNQTSLFVYRSQDQGSSFSPFVTVPNSVATNLGNYDIWLPQYGVSDIFLIANSNSYRIDRLTGNLTATGVVTATQGYSMLTGYRSPAGAISLYAYVDGNILRSADAGQNWTFQSDIGSSPFFKTSFSASVNTPDLLYFGDIEVHKSTNGGTSFEIISEWFEYYSDIVHRVHADIPSVNCLRKADGSEFQLVNTDGGTFISTNNLNLVTNISLHGLNISQYYSSLTAAFDTNIVHVGSQDQGYQRTVEAGGGVLDFEQVISGDYGHIVTSNEGFSIWMVYPGFAIFYPDATGVQSSTWDFDGANTFWMPPLMADPYQDDVCYMANGMRITRLESNGSGVDAENLPLAFSGAVSAVAYSTINPDRWYALTETGRFYRSPDRGQTWTNTIIDNSPGGQYLYGACILPSTANEDVIYICGSGYSNPPVYKSIDNGTTFTPMSAGLPSTLVYRMAGAPNDEFIFAATELGPYVYVPSANEWFELDGGEAPEQTYWSVEYIPSMKTARFVTYGRGVWDFRIESELGISAPPPTSSANVFPNPIAGPLNINWKNKYGNADVKVYSLDGKLAYSGRVPLPSSTIDLPSLSAGTYILVLQSGSERSVHRIVK